MNLVHENADSLWLSCFLISSFFFSLIILSIAINRDRKALKPRGKSVTLFKAEGKKRHNELDTDAQLFKNTGCFTQDLYFFVTTIFKIFN